MSTLSVPHHKYTAEFRWDIPHRQDFVWTFIISYSSYCNLLLPGLYNKCMVSSPFVQYTAAAMGEDSYLPSMVKTAELQRNERMSFPSHWFMTTFKILLVLGCLQEVFCFFFFFFFFNVKFPGYLKSTVLLSEDLGSA